MTQKALQNQLKRPPKNDETFAHTYLLLSEIYKKEKDKTTALEYMEKALKIARISILPHDKFAFQRFQSQWDILKDDQCSDGTGFQEAGKNFFGMPDNPDQQDYLLSNYCKELTQISPDDIVKRLSLLNQIGTIYSKKENYHMAMKYLNEAIEIFMKNQASDRYFSQQLEDSMISIYFSMSRMYYRQKKLDNVAR